MAKFVIANCTSVSDAETTVTNLLDEGYPRDSVSLVGSDSAVVGLDSMGVNVESGLKYDGSDETFWERVKNFFGVGDHEAYEDIVNSHLQDMQNGNILVVVDDALVPDSLRASLAGKDTGYWQADKATAPQTETRGAYDSARQNLDDDETIRLQEERLNVDKENVEAGEVVIKKRVVESNETVNVPLRHEEVVIERRPAGTGAQPTANFEDETFTIPLHEEQVRVSKEPVVSQEVHVSRRNVQESQQVNASLRREELDVEKQGNVVIRDEKDTNRDGATL